jgi:TolB protein
MKKRKHLGATLHGLTIWALLGMLLLASTPLGAAWAAAPGGTGPGDALVPVSDWTQLEPGDSVWYAFQYAGDGSEVQIQLGVEHVQGAAFAVWTPEAMRDWGLGLEVNPVGRGSPDPSAGGDQLWTGRFTTPGTYYVVVEHTDVQPWPSHYLLQVRGDGTSFTTPSKTPAAEPAPAKPSAKPAPVPAPAGKLVFQTSVGGDLYVVNVDGTGLRRVADGMDPSWSPDGSEIAFARWREPRGIWVIDADGSGERRVFPWDETRWTSWSPDGSRVLFSRQHGGHQQDREFCFRGQCFTIPAQPKWKLGIIDTSTGAFSEPPAFDYSRAPHWSPAPVDGGSRLVFAMVDGLWVQSEDGSVGYPLTGDVPDTSPAWSPDGSQVAFVRRQHDHWEIYVVDATGGNWRRLTDTPRKPGGALANSVSPAWSPNGQYIAFLTDRTGRWEIWVMRADGTKQKPMFRTALDGVTLDYGYIGERAISWTD